MFVTVDTGGTKTLVARFDRSGKITASKKFSTPQKEDEYVAFLKEVLQNDFEGHTAEAIVIGLPGIVKDGVAVWCNNLGWENFEVQKLFTDVFKNIPVLIENDANLAGLAETRTLSPVPLSSLYVTISTGIGTGVITNGDIDAGLRHSEGGRMLVEFEGQIKEWEDFASGKAIFETYNTYARDITSRMTWDQIADRISRGFLAIIPMLQPDIVIIGGSIGTYFEHYHRELIRILSSHLPPHIPCPRFIAAQRPEEAVVYGGYCYALNYLAR